MKNNMKLEMFLQNLEEQQLSRNETAVVLNNPVKDDMLNSGGVRANNCDCTQDSTNCTINTNCKNCRICW